MARRTETSEDKATGAKLLKFPRRNQLPTPETGISRQKTAALRTESRSVNATDGSVRNRENPKSSFQTRDAVRKPDPAEKSRDSFFDQVKNQPVLSYYLILVTTLLLFIIGLIVVFSASTITALEEGVNPFVSFGKRFLIYLAAFVAMIVASRLPLNFFKKGAWVFLGLSWLLQILVFVPGMSGASAGGNTNWLTLGGSITIQPSEFMKLALVVLLGRMLADPDLREAKDKKQWFIYVGLPALGSLGLVMLGRDLGTAMVMAALILVALFMAGIPWRYLIGIVLLGIFGATVAVMGSANRRRRVFGFMDASTTDPTGIGYQRQHGLWSLATGGLTGVGPGASREKWSYLPEADTDYIFAILGEEFGLMGTFLVLGLFVVLCLTLVRVMSRATDAFVSYTVAGVIGWIFSQAVINIGAVVGLLPIIGVPLPLVSSGGSSLLSIMAAMGIVMCFARQEPGASEALRARLRPLKRGAAVLARRRPVR